MKIAKITGLLIAGTLACAAATPASATQFINFSGDAGVYGDNAIKVSPFTRNFTFTTGKGFVSATISSVGSGATNIDFKSVTLNGVSFQTISTGFVEFRKLVSLPVAAGVQTLTVSGVGGKRGAFDGVISFDAVPEPATWAMMILGMGAVGVTLRRRQAKVAIAFA